MENVGHKLKNLEPKWQKFSLGGLSELIWAKVGAKGTDKLKYKFQN